MTLKFDGWPSKTIGHLFYATSSYVQHFIAIGEFKLEFRAGASTRFTSTSTGTSTCNMCEYEYEYLIFTWVQVRVRVLVDEYEYKYEYRSMINILYSMYRRHIFGLWQESPHILTNLGQNSNCPLSIQIIFVNIYLFNYSMLSDKMTLRLTFCDVLAVVADINNLLAVQKQKAKVVQYHEMYGK